MLLTEKYAPQTIDDMILNNDVKTIIKTMLSNPKEKLTNLTFTGRPGIGKSCIAKIIAKEVLKTNPDGDILFISASKDNNVEVIRSRVNDFCSSNTFGDLKIIILDEADALTKSTNGSGAQETLRNIIDSNNNDCRFILTANYVERIIEPILSRCQRIDIGFSEEDILKRIVYILKQEAVKGVTKEKLKIFFDIVVKKNFPKIRNIINALQQCITTDNKFDVSNVESISETSNEYDTFVKELANKILKHKSQTEIRQFYLDNENVFDKDYTLVSQDLFKYFFDFPMQQIVIADYIFKMGSVLDKEIQFYAMILSILNDK